VRVHQAGSHLMQERGVSVRDWSWRQTRRRFRTLGHLVAPYRGRAVLSVLTLLLATAIALAPPLLAKTALNDAINGGGRLYLIVGLFLLAGLLNWGMTYAQTYLTGWVGERMLSDPRTGMF
jgi:ABC-type multidrug transport system fused ATPase/permease subunit